MLHFAELMDLRCFSHNFLLIYMFVGGGENWSDSATVF